MNTVSLFIGADNQTGMLDMARIRELVSKNHSGFTAWQATGHWLGADEDTAVVVINDDMDKIRDTAYLLKTELRQDAIGLQVMPGMEFV